LHTTPLLPLPDGAKAMARRLRVTTATAAVAVLAFALLDRVTHPPHLGVLDALKLAALAVLGGGFYFLRRPRRPAMLVVLALTTAAALYAITVGSAILVGDTATTPLITLSVAVGAATLLPWGVAPQVALVGITIGASAVLVWAVNGSLGGLATHQNAAIAVGLALSVYIAYELERRRRALERRSHERRRAEAEVRRLNRDLEGRVRERTAELERLNEELQTQVTVRARAEADLRASEAAVTALIENAADAIWSVDRDHGLVVCNAEARRCFGPLWGAACDPRERGARMAVAWPAEWTAHFDRALGGERFVVEHDLPGPQGTRSCRTAFNPVVVDGRVDGVAVFSCDVTEHNRNEEALRRHRNELTHVLRVTTVNEMATGLAHEINQPLGAIASYAQGCSRRLRAGTIQPAELLDAVDSISAEALRAATIIRRLRSLIRKDVQRFVPFDVREVIIDAVRLSEADARQAGVTIRLAFGPDIVPVAGDAIQIDQVVLNLIRNGVDAVADMPAERRAVVVGLSPGDNGSVEISVADSGPGLPAEVADRLFEPFVSTKPGGLGMGLSISRTIVEAHHGRIWTSPNPTGGTRFHVSLPAGGS